MATNSQELHTLIDVDLKDSEVVHEPQLPKTPIQSNPEEEIKAKLHAINANTEKDNLRKIILTKE